MATIDVLLPVKDGLPYLAASLDSIGRQSYRDWRLLVLDHGSVDGSLALAQRYAEQDRRIEVHSWPDADGLSGLLNEGLARCDSRYVMRHDADDVCLPYRMRASLDAFARDPALLVVGGLAEVIDAGGGYGGRLRLPVGIGRVSAACLFRNPFIHPSLMMDLAGTARLGARYGTDFLRAAPLASPMQVRGLAEDYLLFGQLAILGRCINLPQQLIRYRWHGKNLSVTRFDEQMRVSLDISRFLAHSLCALHNLPHFDPAPFCNHGGKVFDMGGQHDFDHAFDAMAAGLRRALGDSDQLRRELAFRHILATRSAPRMLARFARFAAHHRGETGEWYAVKSWLLRAMPGRACQSASHGVA
ncbi:MAG: glycosyltransferase family A protein [Pseudomonadota bacterium]